MRATYERKTINGQVWFVVTYRDGTTDQFETEGMAMWACSNANAFLCAGCCG